MRSLLAQANAFADISRQRDTILIIEDDDINRGILCALLEGKFSVLEAENGKAGLDVLNSNIEEVSVILLDLLMPVMNGYEFLQEIGKDNRLHSIPVIILTASSSDTDQIKALQLGASDFISKPYNPHVIANRIEATIRLRNSYDMLSAAAIDRLTGAYTSQFFFVYAEKILKNHPGIAYDIVCTNIEGFKILNTRHGRAAADSLLHNFAAIFQNSMNMHEICGRVTADRFVLLLRHKEHTEYVRIVKSVSQKLKESLLEQVEEGADFPPPIIKFGIYENVSRAESVSNMYDNAMLALNSITRKYGAMLRYFDKTLEEKAQYEQNIVDNMELALAANEFEVYYQPKHSIKEGKAAGAEALVRWNSRKFGFMNPGMFVPLFERNGFISRLDYYIWKSVCKSLSECLEKGVPVVPVSLNISRHDFVTKDLDKKIIHLADRYNVPHHLLHLELTESAYNDNPEQITSVVESLHAAGFIIELDDFGSGYSSLSILTKMPFDILKLDMSLIAEIKNEKGRHILRCILDMANRLNMKTVAEGCEDRQTADALGAFGCTYIQGYFYSKPLPLKDFLEYIRMSL